MLDFKVRLISENDCHDVYLWRVDPLTKKMSLNSNDIHFHDHKMWFAKMLIAKNHIGLIAEYDLSKIGVVFFKEDNEISTISINLNPNFRGKKLSSILIKKTIEMYRKIVKKNFIIEANILNKNLPSLKIFQKNGFILESSNDGVSVYRYYENKT